MKPEGQQERRKYGSGSLWIERATNSYQGQVRINGKQYQRKLGFVKINGSDDGITLAEAEQALRQFKAEKQEELIDAEIVYPPRPEIPVFVYFVRAAGKDDSLIKIGSTTYPNERLRDMTAMSPYPLEFIYVTEGGHRLEHFIHGTFRHLRMHGEWFTPAPELLDFIEQVKAGKPALDAARAAVA